MSGGPESRVFKIWSNSRQGAGEGDNLFPTVTSSFKVVAGRAVKKLSPNKAPLENVNAQKIRTLYSLLCLCSAVLLATKRKTNLANQLSWAINSLQSGGTMSCLLGEDNVLLPLGRGLERTQEMRGGGWGAKASSTTSHTCQKVNLPTPPCPSLLWKFLLFEAVVNLHAFQQMVRTQAISKTDSSQGKAANPRHLTSIHPSLSTVAANWLERGLDGYVR